MVDSPSSVQDAETQKNIALVGFMGSGKTTVARRVAAETGLLFVDGDSLVEHEAGKTIPRIFSEDGENAFRALERTVMGRLTQLRGVCIATGGGAFADATSREALLAAAIVVYLEAPFEVLWDRISGDPHRPLLAGDDARPRIFSLWQQRQPSYARAHVTVDANQSIERVVDQIVRVYRSCDDEMTTGEAP